MISLNLLILSERHNYSLFTITFSCFKVFFLGTNNNHGLFVICLTDPNQMFVVYLDFYQELNMLQDAITIIIV